MHNVITIARRELRAYFDSLVAYVVICVSLILIGLFFFFVGGGIWQVDRASMERMFNALPWAFSFVLPLATMRSLAEEKRSGTLELLITMPVRDSEVILGKYFGAFGLVVVLLLATLVYPIAMFKWPWHLGALDWGPVWTAYLGLLLFAGAGLAVGMLFSSITDSQIIAFFLTAAVLALMNGMGWLVDAWQGSFSDAFAFVSFQSRYAPFARGIIDTRAIVYFISVAVIALLVAFRSLESRKWT
jgi:ABC-2 type transport system permease protein